MILSAYKKQHKESFLGKDHEHSWRAFKGKNLEKLVFYIIEMTIYSCSFNAQDFDFEIQSCITWNNSPTFWSITQVGGNL